jgi:hypothetical protein
MKKKKYSNKYQKYIRSKQWYAKSKFTISLTGNRCILLPFLKATQTHHLHYRSLSRETVFFDTVPLSKTAHKLVHIWILWKTPIRLIINNILRVLFIFWFVVGLIIGKY